MRELSGLSDVILLGMVAQNDEAALREIVERHSPWWHLHRVPWLSERRRLFGRT